MLACVFHGYLHTDGRRDKRVCGEKALTTTATRGKVSTYLGGQ